VETSWSQGEGFLVLIVLFWSVRLGGLQNGRTCTTFFYFIVSDERKEEQFKVAAVQQSVSHFVAAREAGCPP
jgi:hypothetical protein